jgi:hypothetical protein
MGLWREREDARVVEREVERERERERESCFGVRATAHRGRGI